MNHALSAFEQSELQDRVAKLEAQQRRAREIINRVDSTDDLTFGDLVHAMEGLRRELEP